MARGSGNRGNAGNRGNSGRTYGKAFRVFGKKKRKPGRPRKARTPLTSAFVGRSALRINAPEAVDADSEPADDTEDLRAARRTEESESK